MKALIVTAFDQRLAELGIRMLRSLRDAGIRRPIGFIDIGVNAETLAKLNDLVDVIVPGGWDIDFPGTQAWDGALPGFKGLVCRPFLRRTFPGYDAYMWIDGDTWVQDRNAIETYLSACGAGGFAATRELEISPQARDWFTEAHGTEIAAQCADQPLVNSGIFALCADAPHWDSWAARLNAALNRQPVPTGSMFMAELTSINACLSLDGLPAAVLPPEYNWLCHVRLPVFDPGRTLLVNRDAPERPISIVHLSAGTKGSALSIATTTGEVKPGYLYYDEFCPPTFF